MGEIADMMLDGTLCEGCGTYVGSGSGFPGYCSQQCAQDRGGELFSSDAECIQYLNDLAPDKRSRGAEYLRIFMGVGRKRAKRIVAQWRGAERQGSAAVSALHLDASGAVAVPVTATSHQNVAWNDLTPFTQGYVGAALRDADKELRHGIAVGDLAGSTQDNQLRTLGFRHLAPDTLAVMMADCERYRGWVGGTYANDTANAGALFWELRALGDNAALAARFPPVALYLSEDGLIHHREASK